MQIDGITFPPTIRVGGDSALAFVGGGTRFKFNVVKVYAAALYLHKSASASSALKPFLRFDGASLRKKSDFSRALVAQA